MEAAVTIKTLRVRLSVGLYPTDHTCKTVHIEGVPFSLCIINSKGLDNLSDQQEEKNRGAST